MQWMSHRNHGMPKRLIIAGDKAFQGYEGKRTGSDFFENDGGPVFPLVGIVATSMGIAGNLGMIAGICFHCVAIGFTCSCFLDSRHVVQVCLEDIVSVFRCDDDALLVYDIDMAMLTNLG